jgi:EAL domain-containing protein (putative c-di-GMP-specific phosphodiesterase class I)
MREVLCRIPSINERIRRALESTDLPPALFEVEITESAAITGFSHPTAVMNELRQQGIGVSIDDFGIGYSTLSYLAELSATYPQNRPRYFQPIKMASWRFVSTTDLNPERDSIRC